MGLEAIPSIPVLFLPGMEPRGKSPAIFVDAPPAPCFITPHLPLRPNRCGDCRLSPSISDRTAAIAEALDSRGWDVVPGFLDPARSLGLAAESRAAWDEGDFRRAGVGRGEAKVIREDIRRDHVMWLEPASATPAQQGYLDDLEQLRLAINRRLFLGLFDFEGHFAIYPEGGFYKAHLDRHRGTADRLVTAILYLNEDWQPGDGGELRIWTTPGAQDGPSELVEPRLGTLVTFLAGDYWHEVLPANKPRTSITGWFRCRA